MYPIVFNVFIILPAPVYLPNLSDTPPLFETFSTLLCEYTFTYLIISEGKKGRTRTFKTHKKRRIPIFLESLIENRCVLSSRKLWMIFAFLNFTLIKVEIAQNRWSKKPVDVDQVDDQSFFFLKGCAQKIVLEEWLPSRLRKLRHTNRKTSEPTSGHEGS